MKSRVSSLPLRLACAAAALGGLAPGAFGQAMLVQDLDAIAAGLPVATLPSVARNPQTHAGSFDIVINPTPALAGNAAALAAFNSAAAMWEAILADPITVNIDADLSNLGNPNIIGSTNPTLVSAGYANIRNQMIADNTGSGTEAVTDAIPAAPSFTTPGGGIVTGLTPIMTQANAKALGFGVPGGADAQITFNSTFSFDFDPGDGIGTGLTDFVTVAAHEIGHALGFISGVDLVDQRLNANAPGVVGVHPLDLFRFGPAANPASLADFGSFARNLQTGVASYTDTINGGFGASAELLMSTGFFTGDGNQASHWKDNNLTGNLIGMMDPTLGPEQSFSITGADMVALDVIGYNVVPEPGEYAAAFGVAALGFAAWRRRGARRA